MRATASSLWLLKHCTHWRGLDGVEPVKRGGMPVGTATHAVLRDYVGAGVVPGDAEIAEAAFDAEADDDEDCDSIAAYVGSAIDWMASIGADGDNKSEVALAWVPGSVNAYMLPGTAGARDYSAAPHNAACGTVDAALRVGSRDRLLAADWKTAADYGTGAEQAASEKSRVQILFYAVALAIAVGTDEILAGQRVLRADGSSWADLDLGGETDPETGAQLLDDIALGQAAAELRELYEKPIDAEPRPGPWCPECPARLACSAMTTTATTAIEVRRDKLGPRLRVSQPLLALSFDDCETPEQTIAAWVYGKVLEDASKKLKELARKGAQSQRVELGDGRVLGLQRYTSRRYLATDEGIATMETLLGKDIAGKAYPRRATGETIEAAAKAYVAAQGKTRGVEPLVEKAREVLRGVGALSERDAYRLTAFKPKDEPKPQELEPALRASLAAHEEGATT